MPEKFLKPYNPQEVEPTIYKKWEDSGYFNPDNLPGDRTEPFTVVLPPPNVTAVLHAGHALNNTLQDILIRWRRMQQDNTLWMPGTDHAGIATQTVVEKRILAEEGRAPRAYGWLRDKWYDTADIRFLSIADFEDFCREKKIHIQRRIALNTDPVGNHKGHGAIGLGLR